MTGVLEDLLLILPMVKDEASELMFSKVAIQAMIAG